MSFLPWKWLLVLPRCPLKTGTQTSQENKIRDTYTCSKDNYISKTSLLAILHDFV